MTARWSDPHRLPGPQACRDPGYARAVQAGRRMVSRGEPPCYRFVALPDGSRGADGLPGVTVAGVGRRDAMEAMRAAIAVVLEVPADAFDVG
jgi:hypothetical protein